MIQIPTTSRIQVMNPTIPNISTSERNPPNPESRLEMELFEPFPLLPFPFPLFEEVTSTATVLLVVWLPWKSVTLTSTSKFPVEEGVHEKVPEFWPEHPAGNRNSCT